MADKYPFLTSMEADSPSGIWGWAKRLVELLNRTKTLEDISLTGKAGYTLKVNADETGFELVP